MSGQDRLAATAEWALADAAEAFGLPRTGWGPRTIRKYRDGSAFRLVPTGRSPCASTTKTGLPCTYPSLVEDRQCHVHIEPARRRRIDQWRAASAVAAERMRVESKLAAERERLAMRRRIPVERAVPIDAADRVSYTAAEAAAATGVGISTIRAAYRSGALPAHYVTSRKPVILARDLVAWVEAAPTELPADRVWY